METGNCRGKGCGIVLCDSIYTVPLGWIIIWHIDCEGYCPECAVRENAGNVEMAQTLLDTIPDIMSNQLLEELEATAV